MFQPSSRTQTSSWSPTMAESQLLRESRTRGRKSIRKPLTDAMTTAFSIEGLERAKATRKTKRNVRKRQVALVAKLMQLGKFRFRKDEDCQTELRRLAALAVKVEERITWRLQDELDHAVESVMET